ncbi:hypothetical protein DFH08DRAFT_1084752 [Mycena albidolilacea]|uniref:Cellobiose dehydrogenase-like cytochrome domain-containing protein n=1 Tax=Mycena albidolilacea TaxID=1033008 RepID=A0AAD6ZKQ5_9AGAR|nr:hypothetical protein DFH08DRAFT_1084752 [Mycena albidolilacea]
MSLLLALTLGCLTAASLGQSHTVCNPVTGLCFEQFSNSALNVTVGFALPPKQNKIFANEVLVLGSFPLPYRFAGITLGQSDNDVRRAQQGSITLAWYSIFESAEAAAKTPFSTDYCRGEISSLGSTHTLTPLIAAPIATTFSPLTTWGNGGAQFIFRCRNCNIVTQYFAMHDKAKLTTVISTSYPVYIDSTWTLANLSLAGSQHQQFTLDTKAARFANYSSILSAAGLL